jgi:hypothetical protein
VAVTLDTLGKRYGMLPSMVLANASTFDLECLDIAITYENLKIAEASGKTAEPSQDELLEVIKKSRSKNEE